MAAGIDRPLRKPLNAAPKSPLDASGGTPRESARVIHQMRYAEYYFT